MTTSPDFTNNRHFYVDVPAQKVRVITEAGSLLWETDVSTSRYGLGEQEGSLRTPRGWFEVIEKVGDGAPLGAVFQSRVPTGVIWTPNSPIVSEDLVLTRILWLSGLEPHNANTQQRYIYFHGTNHESQIGTPGSHGCIRLRNADMIQLFDYASIGTRVFILE